MDSALELVIRQERELQTPSVRRDRERLMELLHPDFIELGASGERWDLNATLTLVEQDRRVIHLRNIEARPLGEDVIQVFWQSETKDGKANRSSLWLREDGRWRLSYHQATPTN